MGYEIHITRANFWAENDGQEIPADDWLALVYSDPTLSIDHENGQYFAELQSSGDESWRWLNWFEGNISAKNPDRVTLQKMLEIADRLDAKVQGDDGERYESVDDIPERAEQRRSNEEPSDSTPIYLRREAGWNWLMYALIVLAVLAVNLLDLW